MLNLYKDDNNHVLHICIYRELVRLLPAAINIDYETRIA